MNNEYVCIRLDEKEIFVKDSTDFYNEESAFSTSKRGIKQAIQEVKDQFNTDTKFSDVIEIMTKNNIKYHRYCAVD